MSVCFGKIVETQDRGYNKQNIDYRNSHSNVDFYCAKALVLYTRRAPPARRPAKVTAHMANPVVPAIMQFLIQMRVDDDEEAGLIGHNLFETWFRASNHCFKHLIKVLKEFLTTDIDITTWRPVISVEDRTAKQQVCRLLLFKKIE